MYMVHYLTGHCYINDSSLTKIPSVNTHFQTVIYFLFPFDEIFCVYKNRFILRLNITNVLIIIINIYCVSLHTSYKFLFLKHFHFHNYFYFLIYMIKCYSEDRYVPFSLF